MSASFWRLCGCPHTRAECSPLLEPAAGAERALGCGTPVGAAAPDIWLPTPYETQTAGSCRKSAPRALGLEGLLIPTALKSQLLPQTETTRPNLAKGGCGRGHSYESKILKQARRRVAGIRVQLTDRFLLGGDSVSLKAEFIWEVSSKGPWLGHPQKEETVRQPQACIGAKRSCSSTSRGAPSTLRTPWASLRSYTQPALAASHSPP